MAATEKETGSGAVNSAVPVMLWSAGKSVFATSGRQTGSYRAKQP